MIQLVTADEWVRNALNKRIELDRANIPTMSLEVPSIRMRARMANAPENYKPLKVEEVANTTSTLGIIVGPVRRLS